MVGKILVDTNIIIEHVNGSSNILKEYLALQDEGKVILFVSTITVFEFYSGLEMSKPSIQQKTDLLFTLFTEKEVNNAISQIAAYLNRSQNLYSKIETNDLLIAATAIHLKAKVLTRNMKHFGIIKGVDLIL